MSSGGKYTFKIIMKRFVEIVLILGQIFIFATAFSNSLVIVQWLGRVLEVISIFVAISIISKNAKSGFKLSWVFIVLAFPLIGGLLYLVFASQGSARKMDRCLRAVEEETKPHMKLPQHRPAEVLTDENQCVKLYRYFTDFLRYPAFENTETRFLCPGEAFLPVYLEELKKAEKYIFLEYFIFQPGKMLDPILDVLEEKAKEGVEVRVIFDDFGCFVTVPPNFQKLLENSGIKTIKFNPFKPVLTAVQNNRDHRKITSIDGKVAFTGGINLSDEYINEVDLHGYWEDSTIMLRGDAAWSLTVIFLQMWNMNISFLRDQGRQVCRDIEDISRFYPEQLVLPQAGGLVIPWADSPMDDENIGEHVYMQMITSARRYLYITSPYLIIDDTMVSALKLAAKGGVDVRIITPHNGDKKFVHTTTRTFYKELLLAGVKIYEFNGFIHSKTYVMDDIAANVGTVNMDFRSMYLHYECGVWIYGTSSVMEVKERFLQEVSRSIEVTVETTRKNHYNSLLKNVYRLVAPLM